MQLWLIQIMRDGKQWAKHDEQATPVEAAKWLEARARELRKEPHMIPVMEGQETLGGML